jgi:hypothetical protein
MVLVLTKKYYEKFLRLYPEEAILAGGNTFAIQGF